MLKFILRDPRFNNNKTECTIVLIPPNPIIPFTNDYLGTVDATLQINFHYLIFCLASHVIPFETTTSRSNVLDKRKATMNGHSMEYQTLYSMNSAVIYKTHHGFIYLDSKRVKIKHSELIYTNSEQCTHLVLYLESFLIGDDHQKVTEVKKKNIVYFFLLSS